MNIQTFLGLILCAAASYATGRRILAWCRLAPDDPLEDWVFSTTTGLILLANLTMLAGFLHLLYPATFWLLILGLIVLNLNPLFSFFRRASAPGAFDGWKAFAAWEKLLVILMGIYLLIRLLNSFAPPITWDATTHHYLVPAMYLKAGYIYDFPHVIFSYYPSLVEMLYLLGMGLMYDLLASHIGWLFGPLIVAAVYVFGAKYLSRRAGLIAAAILLSLGGIGVQMDGGYVDIQQALFCMLCLHKLLDWRASTKARDFILAAVFFSASLASKHLGYAFTIPVLLYAAYVLIREHKRGLMPLLKYIIGFAAIALILPLPWYIRAYILTDNPFFPFPVFGFPTLRYPPLQVTNWINPAFSKNIVSLITYIYYLTTDLRLDEALGRRFTPYFLAMLPFFWVAFRRGVYAPKLLFWICLYFMGFVFFIAPVKTRYMIFFMPFLSLLAADIMEALFLKPERRRNAVAVLVVLLLFVPLLTRTIETSLYMKEHTAKVILGAVDANRYLYRESPRNWGAIDWMNRFLPRDSLVLCIEARMYRLERDWISWIGLEDEKIPTSPMDNVYLWDKYRFTHVWLGDDSTVRTLMYYNILHLPAYSDIVTFKLEDLWTGFFGTPFSDSIATEHVREYWMPRELQLNGYEWYEDGKRVTDEDGNPFYRASRSAIMSDELIMVQVNFMSAIRELESAGGLHIVYPPPGEGYNEELTFILKTDYETYREIHEEVRTIAG